MGFVGVYRAIYDYVPVADNELGITEGDLLLVLEKPADDNWWKAKKKASEEDEDEPEGVIPNNYIEEAKILYHAKALYDYERQSDEEISFAEETVLQVYDTSDSDWTLVGHGGEYGFAPAIYIEVDEAKEDAVPPKPIRPQPAEPASTRKSADSGTEAAANQASAIQELLKRQFAGANATPAPAATASIPRTVQFTPEASDDEPAPSLPQRPTAIKTTETRPEPPGVKSSPSIRQNVDGLSSPGGYHLYNIHEMISHMGKNKKMPTTLGINIAKGSIMIAPERSKDGPEAEWTAEKLTHYSNEGKHVFMELVRPSKSIDFHAGAKDTANEIVAALGELAGAARAEGLREVIAAGTGQEQKTGKMLYEFMAQGDDEVSVAIGDEVIVLDDTQSADWWMVRRLKNGKEGVVPGSYVEITGTMPAPPGQTIPTSKTASKRSNVDQNRLEEERLARDAVRTSSRQDSIPDSSMGKGKKGSRKNSASSTGKPNPANIRTWTDRSGNFKIEAEFIGLKEGKIHLHKLNTVKIAVPVSKMSVEDLEYVERATGVSLEEDKPLSDVKRRSILGKSGKSNVGASVQAPSKPRYDWFDFFLACGVDPQICQRYATAFDRDQMGEENQLDIEPTLLRTLGLKEGDILRVMKYLDSKFGRTRTPITPAGTNGDANGDTGLFSGPDGGLLNKTRKSRPLAPTANTDTVDPRIFEQDVLKRTQPSESVATPLTKAPAPSKPRASSVSVGFDDNAWDLKPSMSTASRAVAPPITRTATTPPAPQRPLLTGAASELSQLSISTPALQPTPAPLPTSPPVVAQLQQQPQVSTPSAQVQPTGASSSLFNQVAQANSLQNYNQQQPQQQQQISIPRQRPQAPPQLPSQTSLLPPPPPPQRPLSAPLNQQQTGFAPPQQLRPQMTGVFSHPAPAGQSMNEVTNQRLQNNFNQQQPQQPQQLYAQPTAFGGFNNQLQTGFQPSQQQPQQTGFGQQFQPQQQQSNFANFQQPQPTGFQQAQPTGFGQPTGFQQAPQQSPFQSAPPQPQQQPQQQQNYQSNFSQPQQLSMQPTGINSFLPPALQPQPTGYNGFGQQQQQQNQQPITPLPTLPPIPQQSQPSPAPLIPQKTGPAPPVRFGASAQKLVPQRTGRANLSQATPQNPFGF